jgi:hypothetical protein
LDFDFFAETLKLDQSQEMVRDIQAES